MIKDAVNWVRLKLALRKFRSRSSEVYLAAIQTLADLGDKRAIQPLVEALTVCCLYHNRPSASNDNVMAQVERFLDRLDDVVCALIRALGSLGQSRDDVFEALALVLSWRTEQSLAWKTEKIEAAAVDALSRLRHPKSVELLIQLLTRYSCTIAVARTLGALGDKRAIEPLLCRFAHSDGAVREAAAQALTLLGETKWKDIIVGDKQDYVRLANCADARLLDCFMEILDTRALSESALVHAARGLGQLRNVRAVATLVNAIADPSPVVRRAVAEALSLLGEADWSCWLQGDDADFVRLAKSGDSRVFDPLLSALEYPSGVSHFAAVADALGCLGDARARRPLTSKLLNTHLRHEMRIAAAEALWKLGETASPVRVLAEWAAGKASGWLAAKEALAKLTANVTWQTILEKYAQMIPVDIDDTRRYDKVRLHTFYLDYTHADSVLDEIASDAAAVLRPTHEGISSESGSPKYHVVHEGSLTGKQIKDYLIAVVAGGGEVWEALL